MGEKYAANARNEAFKMDFIIFTDLKKEDNNKTALNFPYFRR
jgi:hypothetical protein